ncbi:MAG: hypothetical protein U0L09_03145 [Christensenellales bacterium]|nr:hypothetical protein [Christensenellales bacterium]
MGGIFSHLPENIGGRRKTGCREKARSVLMGLLFVLTVLYPAGILVSAGCGYTFRLISVPVFAVVIAAVSAGIMLLEFMVKSTLENRTMRILSAMMAPLSIVNAVFYIFECPQIGVIAGVFVSAGCCCRLTMEYGEPLLLKAIALALSALMALPMVFFSFVALVFGNIGQNTVVKTVESPGGEYYAQIIDSDQGALGGDTLVDVYEKGGIDLMLCQIEKKPQRVYLGDWGEFENMQLHWKDDHCLVINSTEYAIE